MIYTTLPQSYIFRKENDQAINQATDFVTDDDLHGPVESNGFYRFETFLKCEGDATADIQFKFSGPTGSDVYWVGNITDNVDELTFNGLVNNRLISNQSVVSSIAARINGTGIENAVVYNPTGFIQVGDTPGELQLEWAPLAASPSDTILKAKSVLILTRLL